MHSSSATWRARPCAVAILEQGVAGFEVAEGLDAKTAADPNEYEDVKGDLLADRQYLSVAYDLNKKSPPRRPQPARRFTPTGRAATAISPTKT